VNTTRENEKRPLWNAVKSAEVVVSLVAGIVAIGVAVYGLAANTPDGPGPGSLPITTMPVTPPQPTGSGRTKSEYMTEADGLCKAAYTENDSVHQRYGTSIDGVRQTTALNEQLAGDWAQVERPRGDEQRIDDIIGELRQANDSAEQAIFAYRNNDNASYQRHVQDQLRHERSYEDAARSYGHKICGQY
jgi:hypothetical protein